MSSPFSGSGARKAAVWAAQQQADNAVRVQALLDQARAGALDALQAAGPQMIDALDAGHAQARDAYAGAIARLDPWSATGRQALDTYQDALGLNGAAGSAAAQAAFRESPGYRFQVDEATDAVARRNGALGLLGSGNTQQAIADRARGLADAEFGGWEDRLQALAGTGQQAAGTQAELDRGLGDLAAAHGRDVAGATSGNAGKVADLYATFGNLGASNLTTMGNNILNAGTKAFTAGDDAAASKLNFGINALGTVLGGAGKLLGSGGLAGLLGGK